MCSYDDGVQFRAVPVFFFRRVCDLTIARKSSITLTYVLAGEGAMDIEILRMVERLVVVVFGGISIILGYRLFFYLPSQQDHEGKIQLPGMKIVLSRVAPGVFFAAFGSVILFQSLHATVSTNMVIDKESAKSFAGKQQRTFAGMVDESPNHSSGYVQRRYAAIKYVGTLNCLKHKLEETITMDVSMDMAIREAKVALLQRVWSYQSWGTPDTLAVTSDAQIQNQELREIFNELPLRCSNANS